MAIARQMTTGGLALIVSRYSYYHSFLFLDFTIKDESPSPIHSTYKINTRDVHTSIRRAFFLPNYLSKFIYTRHFVIFILEKQGP